MNITVILCTYNRCQSLARALESAAALTLPNDVEWELLIVDNNSRDQTREVAQSFCQRYPDRFRYLFEPKPGKSNALNAGISAARNDILAFLDDDVTVEPSWLQNLTAALRDCQWAGAGGRILPQRAFDPPRWLPVDSHEWAPLAVFDMGPEAGVLVEPPYGTNMTFRKYLFEKYGLFRTDLGPQPGSEIRSEDTEFGARLLTAGERLRYEPAAVVYHEVSDKRLQRRYFLAWWFDKGRAEIRQFRLPLHFRSCWWGIPRHLFRPLLTWTLRWVMSVNPRARFNCKLKLWWSWGQIVECHRQSRQAKIQRKFSGA